jgi:hypothetical protein
VRAFFLHAFAVLGGTIHPREAGRYEITHVPALLRERDRRITGRNRRDRTPVLKRSRLWPFRLWKRVDPARPPNPRGSIREVRVDPLSS